ncbi:MAG: DUF2244 domain-containing protein [Burkholderiales bacterium]|nr:DUF2244 domain-containing protein [Burkholderiales bacterium]
MNPSISGTPVEYSRTTAFNRSLSPAGRIVFLTLIFSTILIVAAGFACAGAWLVLPFAGLEIVALGVAFYLISRRDGDFERLTIGEQAVCVETMERGAPSRVEMNRAWAQLVRGIDGCGRGCRLALRYRGREVAIGRLMNDEQRLSWSRELEGRLTIVNQ